MEVKVITDVSTEPITLSEVKQYCHIDADYSAQDSILQLYISSAREKLEKYLNLSFAEKTLKLQWNGDAMDMPYGPIIEIVSLHPTGEASVNVDYETEGLDFKTIFLPNASDCYIFIPVSQSNYKTYDMTYRAGYNENNILPKILKQALLIQIDWDLKNQGMPVDELSPIAVEKAQSYSRNLFIQ